MKSVFNDWRDAFEGAEILQYFHSEAYSSGGKTEKIPVPSKPGYDLLGIMLNVGGVVISATAAEAVITTGTTSMLDLYKNIYGRINGKSVYNLRTPLIAEAVIEEFTDETLVVSSGRKATLGVSFGATGTATHYLSVPLPFVVKDGEGQLTLEFEWNPITVLYAADVSIAAHAVELIGVYGHYDGQPFGINSHTLSIPAGGAKDCAINLAGETRATELLIGVGADTYIDNVDVMDGNGISVVKSEYDQLLGWTENNRNYTRQTGYVTIPHAPVQVSSYMIENSHTVAITPELISIYLRTYRPKTTQENVSPEVITPAPPASTIEGTGLTYKATTTSARRPGLFGKVLA